MGPCKHKHREADTWSSHALKQRRDESVSCQVMHKVPAIFPKKMNVCMCMYACSYKPICAASGTATRPGGGGLGDAFLRTLTPFDPAQPKKKKKKCRESDCRLADRHSGRQIHCLTDSRGGWREWQWRRKRKENKEANRDKADGMRHRYRLTKAMSTPKMPVCAFNFAATLDCHYRLHKIIPLYVTIWRGETKLNMTVVEGPVNLYNLDIFTLFWCFLGSFH